MNADKLRELNDRLLTCGNDYSDVLLDGAAEIERLRAERDGLRAENKALNEAVEIVRHDSWGQAGVIEKLEARVAELTSLLTEAVNEMEPDIEAKYEAADVLAYPSMARKYEQDMDLPRRIRQALAGKEGE